MTRAAARRSPTARAEPPTPVAVGIALLIVYVVWGSTYLGMRIMVETIPPLAGAAIRFLVAGVVLAGFLALRHGPRVLRLTRRQLAGCALLGVLLPAGGNGLVTLGEDLGASSGVAALIVAAVPLWVVLYRVLSGDRPRAATLGGVLLGFVGLAGLVTAQGLDGTLRWTAAAVVVVATVAWSFGSWVQPRLWLPADPFVTTAYEMLVGGLVLALGAALLGERVDPGEWTGRSVAALVYLVVFGSLAFSAYVWLLSSAPISLVATYAYVNPVVAVALGALVVAEPVTPVIVLCGAVVVGAVAVVIRAERPRREAVPRE